MNMEFKELVNVVLNLDGKRYFYDELLYDGFYDGFLYVLLGVK